jgi:hypothetical protein
MYGDLIYLADGGAGRQVKRLDHDKMAGRSEAWLRDLLFDNPRLLPVGSIDSSFGPLIPLCKELPIGKGRADLVYINQDGLLTIVECKLWNNPEARRKVVGQILDYGSTVFQWTYADLERQVRLASFGSPKTENAVYDQVVAHGAGVEEAVFVDAVSAALKRGRFLLLVVGNGIRSEVAQINTLFQRNLGSGFAFGLVEMALYPISDAQLIVQPRILAKTTVLERRGWDFEATDGNEQPALSERVPVEEGAEGERRQDQHKRWWQPVLEMHFDDPNQETPRLYWPNHVRTPLPWPRTWLTAYRYGTEIAVSIGGNALALADLEVAMAEDMAEILAELPVGAAWRAGEADRPFTIRIARPLVEEADSIDPQHWAISMLRQFSNVIRPRVEARWKSRG